MKFENAGAAIQFMFAGNSRTTVTSLKTGTRFTYKIVKKRSKSAAAPWFVSVLTGPDNSNDYTYIGYVNLKGEFQAGRKGRADCPSFKAFAWAYHMLNKGTIPDQLEVRHEGHCGRCNRVLTVPESIDRGLGPHCAGMIGVE